MNTNINEIAKQYKFPVSIVTAELEKAKNIVSKTTIPPGTDVDIWTTEILNQLLRGLQKKTRGESYTGIILAADKIKDNANPVGKASRRQLHVEAYITDPDNALLSGKVAVLKTNEDGHVVRQMRDQKTSSVKETIVDNNLWSEHVIKVNQMSIVPLDDMKVWPNRKENFSYLRPLPLHQYRTSLIIVLKTSGGYKLAEMDYNSDKLPGKIPLNIPVEFIAVPRETKNGILQLGSSIMTSFDPSMEDFGKTTTELIETLLGGIKYPVSKLNDYHAQMVRDGKKWDTLVMIEAWVQEIKGLDKTPFLIVDDGSTTQEDAQLKVFLHDGIPINFGINSKVYIIGRTSQGDKYDIETKTVLKGVPGDVSIFATGIYAKFNTAPKNISPVTEVNL